MKKIAFILATTIIVSCSSETTTNEATDNTINDSTITETEELAPEKEIEPNEAVQENPLTIEDFPKVWYMLNPREEGSEEFVINKWCGAETQQIHIENEDGTWYVYVLLGQDGIKYKVIEFDAYEEERENYQVMYGSFVLENPDYPDMDVELYDYMWNKDLMFCNFNGFFQDEAMMVSEQNKDNYELVVEECDY